MSIVKRLVKGSPLTSAEHDANIDALNLFKSIHIDLTAINNAHPNPQDGWWGYSSDGSKKFYAINGIWLEQNLTSTNPAIGTVNYNTNNITFSTLKLQFYNLTSPNDQDIRLINTNVVDGATAVIKVLGAPNIITNKTISKFGDFSTTPTAVNIYEIVYISDLDAFVCTFLKTANSSPQIDNIGLNFDAYFDEYISTNSTQNYSNDFEIEVEFKATAESSGFIPLAASADGLSRIIISSSQSKIIVNPNNSTFLEAPITLSLNTRYNIKIRNAGGTYSYSLNDSSYTTIGTTLNDFNLDYMFRGTATRRFIGKVYFFVIAGAVYALNEGAGTTASSVGNSDVTFETNGDATHVDNESWFTEALAVTTTVTNDGVGGNNTDDIISRLPALNGVQASTAIVGVGSNDVLNSTKIVDRSTYIQNYQTILNSLRNSGKTVVVLTIPPAIDSYLKLRHDYSAIYGADNTFDLNNIIDEYNVDLKAFAAQNNIGVIDLNQLFVDNGDPTTASTSWLRNENTVPVSGQQDGVHFTLTGANEVGQFIADYLVNNNFPIDSIQCIGDSNTEGVHLVGEGTPTGETYPARLKFHIEN